MLSASATPVCVSCRFFNAPCPTGPLCVSSASDFFVSASTATRSRSPLSAASSARHAELIAHFPIHLHRQFPRRLLQLRLIKLRPRVPRQRRLIPQPLPDFL